MSLSKEATLFSELVLEPPEVNAVLQELPFALTYAANLKEKDHAVLFYDNLAAAAEYICAYVEAGINRRQATFFVGLDRVHYEALFDQVGIKSKELENAGYLKHVTTEEFCIENGVFSNDKMLQNIEEFLSIEKESGSKSARFVIMGSNIQELLTSSQLIEFEEAVGKFSQYPLSILCCHDSRRSIMHETAPSLFHQLLKSHDHCLFQGIAMPTKGMLVQAESQDRGKQWFSQRLNELIGSVLLE
ncbi:MAG TPA: MEDS domain-containing protein [Candidatus Acidoferrales bacterium]|nr:MEDS domain-containing protein [Candidatus Acidoferrales bacterium]